MSSTTRHLLLAVVIALALMVALSVAAYAGYLFGQDAASELIDEQPNLTVAEGATASPAATSAPPTLTATLTYTPLPSATAPPTATIELVAPADGPAAAETPQPAPASSKSSAGNDEAAELDLATFFDVWQLVEDEYDGDLPDVQDRLYGAITGSLEAVDDPYTRFIRPEIAERLRDDLDGSVSGIGAIVRPTTDGLVEIVRPIDEQPADLAGLLAGDYIVAVDGESVTGMSFDEVLLLVRGPAGSAVTLTIVRQGVDEPIDFTLTRSEFSVPAVEYEIKEVGNKTVAYIKLTSFTQTAGDEVERALLELLAQNPDGILFDLRDNGGGFLDQAVRIADLFLPEGVVLYERSSTNSDLDEIFRSENGDPGESLPLAVMVNAGSASASEIVAGAVQDNARGVLIGETTFGKGSVQHVHTLGDGSELRVTIARWFTPDNRSISDEGIAPDIEVATPADLGGDSDMQLQRALQYLTEGE